MPGSLISVHDSDLGVEKHKKTNRKPHNPQKTAQLRINLTGNHNNHKIPQKEMEKLT